MRKRHSPEFKARAVLETLKEERPINQIASDLEVHPNMLSAWKSSAVHGLATLFERENRAQADKDAHDKQREELYAQIGKLTTQVAWLKKNLVSNFSRKQRCQMLERTDSDLTLAEQADLLSLSRSSLYYVPCAPSAWEVSVQHRIDALYTAQPFYGSRRIKDTLEKEGVAIGRDAVRQFMKERGLEALYPKPDLSKPAPEHTLYPYLLRGVKSAYPNHIWGVDIPYLRLVGGWMYLVAILDWYSRYILSWELSETLEIAFVLTCVDRALAEAVPSILNSDQGSHFTSPQWVERVRTAGAQVSMDGRGRAMDNIFTQRLWRTVTYEHVYLNEYASPREARQGIGRYLHFYCHERPHQSLSYRRPVAVYRVGA